MGCDNSKRKEENGSKIRRALDNKNEAKILSNKKDKNFVEKKKFKVKTIFFWKRCWNFCIEFIFSSQEQNFKIEKYNKNNINYQKIELKPLKWTIYIIDDLISDEICCFISNEIETNFKNAHVCYDALLPIINDINDNQNITIINNLENISRLRKKQPFILFLSNSEEKPNRQSYQNLIKSKFFDIRNINVSTIKMVDLKNEENKRYIYGNIKSKIWKIYSYYNSMGDLILIPDGFIIEKNHAFPYQLNILTCGKPGLGKSSFINIILNDKRAKEGEGFAITNDIIRYSHSFFPIAFYDTPGTDTPDTVQMLKDELEWYNIKLREAMEKIYLIIWFLDYKSRVDIKNEKSLLENPKSLTQNFYL